MTVHVIPVPAGWSIEQAWEHCRREHQIPLGIAPPEGGEVDPRGGGWAVVEVDENGALVRVVEP